MCKIFAANSNSAVFCFSLKLRVCECVCCSQSSSRKKLSSAEVICCGAQMDGKISSGRAVGKFQIRAATAAERWVLAFSFCIQCAWANMHMYLFTQGERAVAGRRRAGERASEQPEIEVNANSVTAHLFANGSVLLLNTTEMQEKRRNAKSVPPPRAPRSCETALLITCRIVWGCDDSLVCSAGCLSLSQISNHLYHESERRYKAHSL